MPEMIRILCEWLATVLFTLICTRFLCKNMKKRDFRFVPWLPYVLTGCGSATLFLLLRDGQCTIRLLLQAISRETL